MNGTSKELAERVLRDLPQKMFIGGDWVPSAKGTTMPVANPATEGQIAAVPDGTAEDGIRAVDHACRAQKSWSQVSPEERSEILRRAWEKMIDRADDLAAIITLENGKPLQEARGEVAYAAEFFRWFSHQAVLIRGRCGMPPKGAGRVLVMEQPVGPALLITPWNFPLAMLTRKIGPAIAAGCTMVVKPAPETPISALALCLILKEAGLPDGVLNVVTTNDANTVVTAMLSQQGIRKISFTGSTAVGKILLHHVANRVLRSSMELGGNAPFIVFSDADIDAAIEGAMVAKMRNGGQSCIAANRIYVQSQIVGEFSSRLSERMSGMKVGPGSEAGVEVGPLINDSGRKKVKGLVADMADRGAAVLVGAQTLPKQGYFYTPTVVTNVAKGSRIFSEEIFGPVAPILSFETEAEITALANNTPYGLAAYVYTRDLGRAMRVSENIEAGMVGLNTGFISHPAAPFGGIKESGLGREGGEEGIQEFLEKKYIYVNA